MLRAPFRPTLFIVLVATGFLSVTVGRGAEALKFNRDIRPLLSDRCFYCHGPDEKTREAKLRLDTREGAITDLGGYAAIVPGQPEKSELLTRIISHDRDEVMPPPAAKKPRFNEQEIATIRQWIVEGAKYEGHWAFMPLAKEGPPGKANFGMRKADWGSNPIDRFVAKKLVEAGIKPSPEAEPEVLIRRMSLDLTGLLPTPEEVKAFVVEAAVDRQSATRNLADRLLASPHYGERWGRHWLDQARYADSNGYSIDGERTMWPYRDWVIKALNDDLPFDRFTIEQIAGDLLPKPTKAQLIATGFHRNTLINQEGGTDAEQFRVEATIDRVNTTGAVWLGLTVGCAQCHTHKFDPITHREYYEMFAFFNRAEDRNNTGPSVAVERGEIFGHKSSEKEVQLSPTDVATLQKAEQTRLEKIPAKTAEAKWEPAEYLEFETKSNAGFMRLEDNSLLGDGGAAFNDSYRVLAKTSLPRVAAVRLRVLTHDSLPQKGPGLAKNGNFVLTEFVATVGGKPVKFTRASADHAQPDYPPSAAIDGDAKTGWAINVGKSGQPNSKMNADHAAIFVPTAPIETKDKQIEFTLRHDLNEKYLIGRFAIELSATVPSRQPDEEFLLAALAQVPAKRSVAQKAAVKNTLVGTKAGKAATLMIMRDLPEARPTFLLTRGDFTRPDKERELHPGGIRAIAPRLDPKPGRTRLDLARWLVARDNPLTPRVTMNRIWMRYFGRGLVETEEDFGTQGTLPTHPELLDWLGREFMQSGWSMKAMHRLIVTSATYRQSSHTRPDAAAKDPRNLLLARQERLRVEAEIIRDAALSASGLLDRQIGGPSVRPPQPEGVYAFTQTAKPWVADTGANRYRRGLYTMFFRSAPYPLMGTFDAPDFQSACTRRLRSNTPLQSLTLANDPAFLEIAKGLAERLIRELPSSDLDARLRHAFALVLAREPSEVEFNALSAYTRRQREASSDDTAALTAAARVLFNTDNFITRE